jgi:hypothetical protein
MNIMVNTRLARVGFQFKAGSPLFTRYGLSEGQQVQYQAEIRIDNDGVMQLMFGTNNKRLETVVRETLQPALFPTVQLSEADKGLEHLA